MTTHRLRPASATLRALRREVAEAADGKIARIVAMVDALPARGDADSLIAPLRPRLAQLGVARPLGFARLLFLPLDPVLLHGPDWRRDSPGVPRTALVPLTTLVRAGLQDRAALIDRRLLGHETANEAVVPAEGRALWPTAAGILRGAAAPACWHAETGLAAADFTAIAEMAALVLAQAGWMQQAATRTPALPQDAEDAARSLAELVRPDGSAEAASACLLVVILATLPDAAARIETILSNMRSSLVPPMRRAQARAMTFLLDRLESGSSLADTLSQAAESLQRDARLLDEMAKQARSDPARRARVEEVRRTVDQQCRVRFQAALASDLAVATSAAPASDELVAKLEQAARVLHRFQQSARRIGSRDFYDAALRAAAARFAEPQFGGLSDVDRVRMTELLLGPEPALALLQRLG